MGYEKLHRQRERAQQIQDRYNERVAAIRANKDLSEEGRQRQLAGIYAESKARLAEYSASEREHLASRKAELEKELFGARKSPLMDAGSYAISTRDASDRASQMRTPEEAQRLLEQAEANGDDILCRAVARVSTARSDTPIPAQAQAWEGVLRAYLDSRPHLTNTVEELAEIETLQTPQIFGPYSITAPRDVPVTVLNATRTSPEPERLTTGPLRNPATTSTTREDRADWTAALTAETV